MFVDSLKEFKYEEKIKIKNEIIKTALLIGKSKTGKSYSINKYIPQFLIWSLERV